MQELALVCLLPRKLNSVKRTAVGVGLAVWLSHLQVLDSDRAAVAVWW